MKSFVIVPCVFLLYASPLRAALQPPKHAPGLTQTRRQALEAKRLRGYGEVEGEFAEYRASDQSRVSVLIITCEDAPSAALTLGKYLSDLRCLGGVSDVTVAVGEADVPALRVEGQGCLAACRQGKRVAVVASEREQHLAPALTALLGKRPSGLDTAGGAVPLYLDRFDQYGWHFYFNPWSHPKDDPTYDLDTSFRFLAKNRLGMMIPLALNNIDSTEEVINTSELAWAIERGRELNIPTYVQAWAIGAPRLLINRYPYDTTLYMPQFVGNLYGPGENGGGYPPEVAWSSEQAEDTLLSWLQPIYRRYASYPNVTGYAEPHGEIEHGTPMIFTEYGPVADKAFRRFLKEKYRSPRAVDHRWTGGHGEIRAWDDVHVPEVASFLGWNADAIDVGGRWRVAREKDLSEEQRNRWSEPALDDSAWQSLIEPGDDHPRFRNQNEELRVPGVFRRTFTLDGKQRDELLRKGGGKCTLYVWTLARAGKTAEAAINGTKVGRAALPANVTAWCAFEVGGALRAGDNLLALRLPWSEIAYRVYLSPVAPHCYPDLGAELNARWVDFRDFAVWTRAEQMRKGMETIRREDPNRFLLIMSPNGAIDDAKALAEDYGAVFHNTGYMSGWWNDYLPSLMRSSGLPFTLEPGNGAPDLPTLKRFAGHWFTEGINGVNYFQNVGEVLWDPQQKAWFEAHQPLIHLLGKYHAPAAQVAVLYSGRSDRLSGCPWDAFDGERFGLMADSWARMQTESEIPFPRDILLDTDFARGNADRYKVIIAAGTVIMEPALVDDMERWVRKGGVLVAYGSVGRHTPEVKDAWPLARLSGYRINPVPRHGHLTAAAGQTVFTGEAWSKPVETHNRILEPVTDDVQTLVAWEDGKPAVGLRKVGQGLVITVPQQWRGLLDDVLRWSGTYTERPTADRCFPRRYVSNNGLYSVYALWANNVKEPGTTSLLLPGADAPKALRDVVSGATLAGVSAEGGVRFEGIAVDKDEIHAFLAPRGEITRAALDWFTLQRDWWQGTVKPRPAPQVPAPKNTLPLNRDWAFTPVAESVDATSFVAPDVNDTPWTRIDLGIWNVQGFPNVKRGVFRKTVILPSGWKNGRVWAWLAGSGATLRPPYKVRFFVDGKLQWASDPSKYSVMSLDLTDALAPGKHTLAWDMEGDGTFDGVSGDMWLEFVPEPAFRQSLAGRWEPGITLPGTAKLTGAKRSFVPDPRGKDLLATLCIDGKRADIQSVFINNKNVYFYGGPRGHHRRLTLNPWLKWGEENELELKPHYTDPMDITTVEIRYYRPDQL